MLSGLQEQLGASFPSSDALGLTLEYRSCLGSLLDREVRTLSLMQKHLKGLPLFL